MAAGPVMCTVVGLPSMLCWMRLVTRLYDSKAFGVPNSPARPTGSTQVLLS
ncbi:Uncharacterised protein [Mycobacteroides abscessus subsp. abscessus]|nr:Uncharacterised protein [Mycobacteroides abscessus]SIN59398.1 Uncharacterised protein [Mycobacteroides abscessus subsp. abscessus]SKT71807.1 Uncharacterised protein [Mycobacteroides abscessus subsp. abscessus]